VSPSSVHDSTQMSLQGFDGGVALVTGGASGIGRRVVETALALGARVAACDLNEPEVDGALGLTMDVTDPDSVAAAVAQVESELGPPSILVTSAGVFTPMPFDRLDLKEWRRTMEVNVTGTYICVDAVLPGMRERGYGRIVTVSSMAGVDGGHNSCVHYATSKGGVNTFTMALAKECAADGVTVNSVAPRNVRTPMLTALDENRLVEKSPMGRLAETDDVAAAIAFLGSAHAGYVTGNVFEINGGWF
jgi:2-hydroxycyclohexanecarboxyl-CoA dehydrogenase